MDGRPEPSVTTVLEVLDKSERLMPWAAKITAEHLWERWTDNGHLTEEDCKTARAMPWVLRDRAGEWGTQLHHLAEQITRGNRPPLSGYPPEVLVALQGWLKWWAEARLTPIAVETIIYLPPTRTPGTLDLVARTPDGRLVLVDYKTSNYLHPQFWMQGVAYATGWEEENWPEKIDEVWILRFEKDEAVFERKPWQIHTVKRPEFERHLQGFAACCALYRWRQWASKSRKG